MIGAREDGASASSAHRICYFRGIGRNHHGAHIGLHGATPYVDDHRLAANVGEGLARQAGGRKARRDQNEWIHGQIRLDAARGGKR